MGHVLFVELGAETKLLPEGAVEDFGEEAAIITHDGGAKLITAPSGQPGYSDVEGRRGQVQLVT